MGVNATPDGQFSKPLTSGNAFLSWLWRFWACVAQFHVAAHSPPFSGPLVCPPGAPPLLEPRIPQEELFLLTVPVVRGSTLAPMRLSLHCACTGLHLSTCGSGCHLDGPLVHISPHLPPGTCVWIFRAQELLPSLSTSLSSVECERQSSSPPVTGNPVSRSVIPGCHCWFPQSP